MGKFAENLNLGKRVLPPCTITLFDLNTQHDIGEYFVYNYYRQPEKINIFFTSKIHQLVFTFKEVLKAKWSCSVWD